MNREDRMDKVLSETMDKTDKLSMKINESTERMMSNLNMNIRIIQFTILFAIIAITIAIISV